MEKRRNCASFEQETFEPGCVIRPMNDHTDVQDQDFLEGLAVLKNNQSLKRRTTWWFFVCFCICFCFC